MQLISNIILLYCKVILARLDEFGVMRNQNKASNTQQLKRSGKWEQKFPSHEKNNKSLSGIFFSMDKEDMWGNKRIFSQRKIVLVSKDLSKKHCIYSMSFINLKFQEEALKLKWYKDLEFSNRSLKESEG